METNSFIDFLITLGFKEYNIRQRTKIYTFGKYEINLIKDFYGVCSMSMFYNNIEVLGSITDIIYLNTESILYSFKNIFENDNDNMNIQTIKNDKCREELKRYIENNTGLKIISSHIDINWDSDNIKLTLEEAPIYILKRDDKVNKILEKYDYKNTLIGYENKISSSYFQSLKDLLDKRIQEERLKNNVLLEFCTELMNIGFKSYKNNTIFKYTDNVRIVIREKTVELYYFGYKESFYIGGYVLMNIIDKITEIESKRK